MSTFKIHADASSHGMSRPLSVYAFRATNLEYDAVSKGSPLGVTVGSICVILFVLIGAKFFSPILLSIWTLSGGQTAALSIEGLSNVDFRRFPKSMRTRLPKRLHVYAL